VSLPAPPAGPTRGPGPDPDANFLGWRVPLPPPPPKAAASDLAKLLAFLVIVAASAAFGVAIDNFGFAALGPAAVLVGIVVCHLFRVERVFRDVSGWVVGLLVATTYLIVVGLLNSWRPALDLPYPPAAYFGLVFVGLDWRRADRLRPIVFLSGLFVAPLVVEVEAESVVLALLWLVTAIATLWVVQSDIERGGRLAIRVPLGPGTDRPAPMRGMELLRLLGIATLAAVALAVLIGHPSCSPRQPPSVTIGPSINGSGANGYGSGNGNGVSSGAGAFINGAGQAYSGPYRNAQGDPFTGDPSNGPYVNSQGQTYDGPYFDRNGQPFTGPYLDPNGQPATGRPSTGRSLDGGPLGGGGPSSDGGPYTNAHGEQLDGPYTNAEGDPFTGDARDGPYVNSQGQTYDGPYYDRNGHEFSGPYPGVGEQSSGGSDNGVDNGVGSGGASPGGLTNGGGANGGSTNGGAASDTGAVDLSGFLRILLIGLLVGLAVGLVLLASRAFGRDDDADEPSKRSLFGPRRRTDRQWAIDTLARLSEEGTSRGRGRQRSETVQGYVDELGDEVLADERMHAVGRVLSDAFYAEQSTTPEQRAWVDGVVDEVLARPPAAEPAITGAG
jgi:hypothetical protein